jgi:enoyl-CoA hydratase/carnithine racemase
MALVPVSVSSVGPAQLVTLGWTAKRNALGPGDVDEVAQAVNEAGAAARSAVILTGEGAFCAGGDLRAFAEVSRTLPAEEIEATVYGRVQSMIRVLGVCPVPTIAAVDGPAVGLGFDLALACDMRMIGPDGWFQQGWARANLIAGTGGIGLLRRLNPVVGWRMIATQEKIGAEQAVALGLGEPGRPDGMASAAERASQLAAIEPDVLRHYCRLSRDDAWPSEQHFRDSAAIQAGLIGSARFRTMADRILGPSAARSE